jgi:hypothetical protein
MGERTQRAFSFHGLGFFDPPPRRRGFSFRSSFRFVLERPDSALKKHAPQQRVGEEAARFQRNHEDFGGQDRRFPGFGGAHDPI